jgi:hypothetical protein
LREVKDAVRSLRQDACREPVSRLQSMIGKSGKTGFRKVMLDKTIEHEPEAVELRRICAG